jgi:hypothetical protein
MRMTHKRPWLAHVGMLLIGHTFSGAFGAHKMRADDSLFTKHSKLASCTSSMWARLRAYLRVHMQQEMPQQL